ncbi:MAG: TonB-dependent receptor [Sphingomonas bacterium]|nr:TonB-dependent receptor [Sphingomonas bacterium]
MRMILGAALGLFSVSAAAQAPVVDPATDDGANDIVVTAQKREQSLQDVSLAVTAVGADRLTSNQINNLSDLQTIVPAVNFGNDFNQAKIFIRGVGANTSTTGNATGVALHVDGAVVSRAEAQLTSLFDLERVEVLRGPQGSLYGRNATGGSINLITAKPKRDMGGYARVSYGNYNSLVGEAAITGPISDMITFRIAGKTEDRDGYGKNPFSGRDVDDLKRRMARAHLMFDFSDTVDLLLTGEYFRQDDASGAVHYLGASFPGVARLASLGVGGYATRPRDLATESEPGTDSETYAFTGTLRAELSDAVSVTNIANYRNFKSSLFQDLDLSSVLESLATNGQPTTVQERRIDSKQYSNELQFNYNSDFVNGVFGLFYFHERQRPIDSVGLARRNGQASNIPVLQAAGIDLAEAYQLCGYGPGTAGGTVIAPKRVCTRSNLGTTALAGFGQINLDFGLLSDGLAGVSLKLGGRYSHEKVSSENPSIVITRGGLGPVLRFTTAQTRRERKFNDFTPEVGLSWEPTDNLLLYYTYSEGFKAGSGENASGSTTIVDPETLKNHEAGIKATLLDRMLTANLAVYSYKLDDAQLNKTIAGGPTGYTTIFQNAASTSAKGFEIELAARPADILRLNAAVSYTDAHFTDYMTLDPLNPRNIATPGNIGTDPATAYCPVATCPELNIQLAGNPTRNSPRWAWNLHGELDVPIDAFGGGKFTLMGDVSHKSRTYFSEFRRAVESSRAYTMVDGSLAFTSGDARIRAQLWVKNLFDIDRPSSTFALATGRLIGVTYLPPRTYGATIGYTF